MRYFKNSVDHYGLVAIFLHWLIAISILGQIFLGWYMTTLEKNLTRLKLIGWHKEFGILILMLVTLRLFWRSINMAPSVKNLTAFERIVSRTVHWLLYVLMFAVPLSGWIMSSAKGLPVSFFGLFILPDLVSPDRDLGHQFEELHGWLAYGLLATIGLHVAGALKHHFINKDNILQRML
jgi:cytochrome b561